MDSVQVELLMLQTLLIPFVLSSQRCIGVGSYDPSIASQACLDCLDGCSGQITSSETLQLGYYQTFSVSFVIRLLKTYHLFFGFPFPLKFGVKFPSALVL